MGITKESISDNFYLSKKYEDSLSIDTKKQRGIYYTPRVIVDYIINKTVKKHNIIENPYPKILDISCGCGNFLLQVYDTLYDMFEENIYDLREKYGDYFDLSNIHNHIISNCIYGFDIDSEAIDILKQSLLNKDKDSSVDNINIMCIDSLIDEIDDKFDYIIGNPPYVGHKVLDKEYKKVILEKYQDVYKGKSDLYFCFYKKIISLLKDEGVSSIITPRYFMESPSGLHLRNYINKNVKIEEIIDFLGANIFKNIGVCSIIITFKNSKYKSDIDIYKIKDENINIDNIYDLEDKKKYKFEFLTVYQDELKDDWLVLNDEQKELLKNINKNCNYLLKDIVTSFQGIITGCDKAFVINKDNLNIDKEILKDWIKNKNIKKYVIEDSNLNLIYADDINDDNNNALEYIAKYKEKLSNRRECRNNTRKWYELQWGRQKGLFEQVKIMYPYKSSENKFAIDYKNSYCSADIYSFIIKENYKNIFSYEYLVGILNSSTYDKYFKMIGKKISKNIYDYYPNKVMNLKIFKNNSYEEIESLSNQIINILKEDKISEIDLKKVKVFQDKIDNLVKDYISS